MVREALDAPVDDADQFLTTRCATGEQHLPTWSRRSLEHDNVMAARR